MSSKKKGYFFIQSSFSLLFSLFCSTTLFASPWEFEIAPYLWAINMNGTVGVGPEKSHIDESFTDLLKHLDMGGMLYLTAHQDKLGFYFNGVYASLSDSGDVDDVTVDAKNKFGILGAGISYIALTREWPFEKKLTLEPYAGLRYTFNDTTLKADGISFKKNVNWTDPLIGLQLNYDFNKCWAAKLDGDIGGTNTSTHYSYSAGAFLKYQSADWKHLKTYLGYRLLDQHYETGSGDNFYDWNIKLFGPVLGLGFTF